MMDSSSGVVEASGGFGSSNGIQGDKSYSIAPIDFA